MQNYGQNPPGYQRPGSVASFASAPGPPPPPPYGAQQGYQSAAPQSQSQWAPPAQNAAPNQQWNQPQQATGGYNPGTYGAMPGAYTQGQQAPAQTSTTYPSQQQDVPPPPPPKPAGYPTQHQQQNAQGWGQQPAYGAQQSQQDYQAPLQNASFTQVQQGGYPQQNAYQSQATQQPSYNATAPPPPSQTPGGSYFPPSQTQQGRPGSIYGAEQAGVYSSPASAVAQQPPNSVLSPNEQQPAYIPPSLTGQGVQSYMPANSNPMPGVYIPPPPDIPAWQQAQHAPLQGGKKFKYTKPTVDPSFYAQGYQGVHPVQQSVNAGQYATQTQQNQPQYGQTPHGQFQPQIPQAQAQYGHPAQNQFLQSQGQQQEQFRQPVHQQYQFDQTIPQQPPPPPNPTSFGQPNPRPQQPQQNQWQPTPSEQAYDQRQQSAPAVQNAQHSAEQQTPQPGHHSHHSMPSQQYSQGQDQGIQAPTPVGHTGSTPAGFINQPSPQSTPVSPLQHRNSVGYSSNLSQTGLGRTGSVSSIALGAIHAQRAGNRTQSPKPPPPKLPTPPPPRDDKSKFSVLAMGGPSDWEHLGAGVDEIDDEEWFGAKKEEKKAEAAHTDSVELPAAVPSPLPAQTEWPSPASQTVPPQLQGTDSYQPTPPQSGTPVPRPSSQAPQQGFIVGDAPPQQNQQHFVMGDVPVASQTPQPTQYSQPHPDQQVYAMDTASVPQPTDRSTHRTPAPAQQPAPTSTSFVVDDGNWGATEATPTRDTGGWRTQASAHAAELSAKDEAYQRLKADAEKEKADAEKEKADIRHELNKLNVVIETVRSHAESERGLLMEQIDSLKAAAVQVKSSNDASNKEQGIEIERLKEDAEGKDDTIKEKDATIAELRKQVQENNGTIADLRNLLQEKDSAIAALQQQLDAEKSRDVPKPTPADLVPDIDPWYASSLERYIGMLRSETVEPGVEDKIKAFTSFLEAESNVRGLPYYSVPPPASVVPQHEQQTLEASQGTSNTLNTKQVPNVQVPPALQQAEEDEFDYSPGGRPVLRRKGAITSNESIPTQYSFNMSSAPSGVATTVLTPTSSQEDSFNKTPTPVQSPPEEQPQPQYMAYVPPAISQADSAQSLHRQSMSFASTPPVATSTPGSSKNHDEIFFGAKVADHSAKTERRPKVVTNQSSDASIPAPLFTPKPPAAAATSVPVPTREPSDVLRDLIPSQIAVPASSALEDIRKKLSSFSSDFSFIQETTGKWERAAALTRKKNDDARRKRQEESEAHTNSLYEDQQISYVEIGPMEDEYKEKERRSKAQEDRDEYKTYVEEVFDNIYGELQSQIQGLTDLYIEAESLVQTSVSGIKSLERADAISTAEALEVLKQVHDSIELRHERVVLTVSERDKRYKKTEIQPLYAGGNITKMKTVEKHFEIAEKQAVLRAKSEKAERMEGLVKVAEEAVVSAVGIEQGEIDGIVSAIRALPPSSANEALLARVYETLLALQQSSKTLLSLFNEIEIELNSCVIEAEIAQARAEGEGLGRVRELEEEKVGGEWKAREELKRRVQVIDQDRHEFEGLVREKSEGTEAVSGKEQSQTVRNEEDERKERLQRALEEAKRRNGHI